MNKKAGGIVSLKMAPKIYLVRENSVNDESAANIPVGGDERAGGCGKIEPTVTPIDSELLGETAYRTINGFEAGNLCRTVYKQSMCVGDIVGMTEGLVKKSVWAPNDNKATLNKKQGKGDVFNNHLSWQRPK